MLRSRRVWFVTALFICLGLASQTLAARAPAQNHNLDGMVQQEPPTPTPGWGPIITAPPPAPTDTPGGPTPIPSLTPVPTTTPPPTATPRAPEVSPTPEITGTPLPTYKADLMGIQIDPAVSLEDYETMLWLVSRLGVKWVKFQFAWDLLEPQQGSFSDVLYKYRLMVQRADQAGLKVMISIAKAPDWARASAEEEGPPRNPQDLASFISRMMGEVRVDMYGNSYFEAIEVWNEPNLRREWNGGTLGGGEYMRYFDAAYNAIRSAEGGQSVTIITAGLAPTGINDGVAAIDDRVFLQQMYAAGLSNPAYQNIAIGVHPYGAANPPDARWCGQSDCGAPGYNNHPSWFFLNTLEDYHAIMQENGDTGRQLWATEFGWGTYQGFTTSDGLPAPPPADPPYFQWITEKQQGDYIMRAFEIGQSLPYLGPMILWNLNYASQDYLDAQDPRAAYALLRGGADPLRPAFRLIEAAPKQ
jgi:hypothetical protein